jgi:hypothetical protein
VVLRRSSMMSRASSEPSWLEGQISFELTAFEMLVPANAAQRDDLAIACRFTMKGCQRRSESTPPPFGRSSAGPPRLVRLRAVLIKPT